MFTATTHDTPGSRDSLVGDVFSKVFRRLQTSVIIFERIIYGREGKTNVFIVVEFFMRLDRCRSVGNYVCMLKTIRSARTGPK